MAHPHKREAGDSHNAKLRRMTEDYGSASGAKDNIAAPDARYKQEGPEEAVGFGADATRPRPSAAKPSREQQVSNPVATLKRGGAAKRAHGGRAGKGKKHGNTHVNVIVAPQGGGVGQGGVHPVSPVLGAGAPPPGAPPAMPPRPPMGMGGPPMAGGPLVPGGPGGAPIAPGAPGGMPPGMIPPRKHGGRTHHSDEKEDKALIERELKKHHLVRARGGSVEGGMGGDGEMTESLKEQGLKRFEEGHSAGSAKKHKMTAGGASGEGRLEKIGKKPHDAGRPQAV